MPTQNYRNLPEQPSDARAKIIDCAPYRVRRQLDYLKVNGRWLLEVRFDGDADLAIFEKCARGSSIRLAEYLSRTFVEDAEISSAGSEDDVRRYEHQSMPAMHGAINLLCGHYVPPKLRCVMEFFPDGHSAAGVQSDAVKILSVKGSREVREFLAGKDQDLPSMLHQIERDADLKEGLVYYGLSLRYQAGNPWANLYKAWEVVRDKFGGESAIVAKGWCSRNQAQRLTRTANHQEALGAFSRHARNNATPPPDPMKLEEAYELLRHIYKAWVGELGTSTCP